MEAVLIYPHQLFEDHPALASGRMVYLVEDPLYFSQYKFHMQKLVLHRASMKAYAELLGTKGYGVRYIDHAVLQTKNIGELLADDGMQKAHIVDVVDTWLEKRGTQSLGQKEIQIVWYETPQFLTSDTDIKTYWKTQKHLQQHFYIWQRKRLDVLMENGKPSGGKWSFDAENRKSLPKGVTVPSLPVIKQSPWVQEAIQYVRTHFDCHYGNPESFSYATTHEEARQCLDVFLKERFPDFGAYEDAMTMESHTLFHSVLSPYLNCGLLTPREVLDVVLEYAATHTIPLASLEGFIRQLIGWREFIRMVYVCDGTRMRNQNALYAQGKLTEKWWNGTTGLLPVDDAIMTLKEHAYTHHIVRLMVVGNAMSLLGIHPHECYRWFMEWYIDAYDWVMVPNVYGMALFADGGSMVTKPYVSSSRYIMKMSDYPKGAWSEAWDALYWQYVATHRDMLLGNFRASFSVRLYDRFPQEKKDLFKLRATEVCAMLTA